jgi:polysaccharide export outer membrane protein
MQRLLLTFWLILFSQFIPTAAQAADADYTLAGGDVIRITVYDHADLTTEIRVGANGEINFPLIGSTKVGGLSLRQAETTIAESLTKGGFVRDSQVNINVVQYRGQQINVLGYVNHPGRFQLEKSSTVSDLLAMAQGIAVTGAEEIILIRRDGQNVTRTEFNALDLLEKGDPKLDVGLQDGDILFVPREPRYYIYGEVQRPGVFRLEHSMTVVQALSVGGGLTPRGTQRGIRILRRNKQGKTVEVEARLDDPVQRDDVIYVKESLF